VFFRNSRTTNSLWAITGLSTDTFLHVLGKKFKQKATTAAQSHVVQAFRVNPIL